jgi:AcrR family transcriptional regulator
MPAYHHGDLRRALIAAALEVIAHSGPSALSLRDLARHLGVSHAAPAHHFHDKRGLLTAIAADGHRRLADELGGAWRETGSFLEVGVAYVRFAVRHRAHFEVMFRPDLVRRDDLELQEAAALSRAALYEPLGSVDTGGPPTEAPSIEQRHAGIAAWSLVHGLATLWLDGNLSPELASDPEELTRSVARYLYPPAGS